MLQLMLLKAFTLLMFSILGVICTLMIMPFLMMGSLFSSWVILFSIVLPISILAIGIFFCTRKVIHELKVFVLAFGGSALLLLPYMSFLCTPFKRLPDPLFRLQYQLLCGNSWAYNAFIEIKEPKIKNFFLVRSPFTGLFSVVHVASTSDIDEQLVFNKLSSRGWILSDHKEFRQIDLEKFLDKNDKMILDSPNADMSLTDDEYRRMEEIRQNNHLQKFFIRKDCRIYNFKPRQPAGYMIEKSWVIISNDRKEIVLGLQLNHS